MNIIISNNKRYQLESVWRESVNDATVDSMGNRFPYPREGKVWSMKKDFIKRLDLVQSDLLKHKKFTFFNDSKKCLLNSKHNYVTTGMFEHQKYRWEDGLIHYITYHNTKPSDKFIEMIYDYLFLAKESSATKLDTNKSKIIRYEGRFYRRDSLSYIKITRNQMLVLDALMHHGGKVKRYASRNNIFRYSEHAGALDFDNMRLDRIIVSAKTTRIDSGDNEIYLPNDLSDLPDYEYIFHTHPPTPKPGGRSKVDGILYEFPSIGDILHFADHANDGYVLGSLVVAPEGLYNIRKNQFNGMKIKYDEDSLYRDYLDTVFDVQRDAIEKFGTKFSDSVFFNEIVPTIDEYLIEINNVLQLHDMIIDFFPREKSKSGEWHLDNIFLPVLVTEPTK